MHNVHFYSFRILLKKGSTKSFKLGDLNITPKITAYDIIERFFNLYKTQAIEFGASKTVISLDGFNQLTFDSKKKLIYGYVKTGKYGEVAEIKDKNLIKLNYQTKLDDVVLMDRYLMIYLPDNLDEGFVAVHAANNISPRTIIFDKIIEYIKKTYKLEARFNPLQHKKIPDAILDAELSDIRAIGFKPHMDITDAKGKKATHIESTLIIKNENGMFGTLRKIMNKNVGDIIEVIEKRCDDVKVGLKVGNRNIVFNYQSILKKGISVELDDNNININVATGVPGLKDIHAEIVSISNDLLLEIHSGNKGVKI
ncbi:TPA: hypothetical protein SMI11_002759 [Serratia marcescens]|nr:hypothetical protein [Serratia marcescens]HEJ7895669.1 hypothetical protein [Serratia marcescens]